jgi:hypothetical protein
VARIRSIRPELRELAEFACLTDGAARLFLMLYTIADDKGRCPAGASYLAGAVFFGRPRSPTVIGRLITELETATLVRRYEVNGAPFVQIAGWSDEKAATYQRIEKRQRQEYPASPWDLDQTKSRPNSRTSSQTDLDLDLDRDLEWDQEGTARGSAVGCHAIELFTTRFENAYGSAPTWDPKQRRAIDKLIAQHGEPEVERRIAIAFDSPPTWPPPPYDPSAFVRHFDRFVAHTNGVRTGRPSIERFTDADHEEEWP